MLYLSVVHSKKDKERNSSIKLEVEKMIEDVEDETLAVIGDFSGHTGI